MIMGNNRVIVVTDTTACLPVDLAARLEVEVVPVVYVFGKESFRDGIDMTTTQFYEKLQTAKQTPTTSGALTEPYLEAFTRAAQKTSSVLCLNLSAKLSSMVNSARLAKDLAGQKLPGLKIEVIDTGTAAGAQGLIVTAAAAAAQAGGSLAEISQLVRQLMPKVHLYAMLDTLHFLVKGGRAPKAAEIASFLQIKPIIGVIEGVAKAVETSLTTPVAMRRLVQLVDETSPGPTPLHAVAMHAGAPAQGRKLLDKLDRRYHPVESGLWEFTPVMGAHTGPGLVAVAFYRE
jgi:DegV family protein with EDD domain